MIYKKELSIIVTKNKEKSCFMFKVYCCTHYHSFIKFCCLSSAKMLLCLRKLSLKKYLFSDLLQNLFTLPLLSVSDGVLSNPHEGTEFVTGSTFIYTNWTEGRGKKYVKNSFLKFQLTHFSKHNNLQSITYAVRSFLSLRRHPGIDFKLTSDVFRIFGGVDLFRLSVFVVKYFSLCSVKSADLLQCAFFSAFAFTH